MTTTMTNTASEADEVAAVASRVRDAVRSAPISQREFADRIGMDPTALSKALRGYSAWVTGVRRVEAPTRANAPLISFDEAFHLVKINPLATWTDEDMQAYIDENDVLVNPLVYEGYPSIGCAPCTAKVAEGADPRSGRWQGQSKTECGLHAS